LKTLSVGSNPDGGFTVEAIQGDVVKMEDVIALSARHIRTADSIQDVVTGTAVQIHRAILSATQRIIPSIAKQ
jgi:hypothetical protein